MNPAPDPKLRLVEVTLQFPGDCKIKYTGWRTSEDMPALFIVYAVAPDAFILPPAELHVGGYTLQLVRVGPPGRNLHPNWRAEYSVTSAP